LLRIPRNDQPTAFTLRPKRAKAPAAIKPSDRL